MRVCCKQSALRPQECAYELQGPPPVPPFPNLACFSCRRCLNRKSNRPNNSSTCDATTTCFLVAPFSLSQLYPTTHQAMTPTVSRTARDKGTALVGVPNVALIGLGAISSGYGSPDEAAPYCHVGGLLHSKRLRLHSVADVSAPARDAFAAKWGDAVSEVRVFQGAKELLDSAIPDEPLEVVGVCVRGPYHFQVMREVLEAAPRTGTRAIFLEKPPTCSLAEMDELSFLASQQGVSITVSYSRHWAPHVLHLESLVRNGLI
ncbi:Gfo/Idh/MocA family oxidoreductase, partial [bacterium]